MAGENTLRGAGQDDESLASMGLRERKKLIRLQRIVASARKLFVDKGFTTTTIQTLQLKLTLGWERCICMQKARKTCWYWCSRTISCL